MVKSAKQRQKDRREKVKAQVEAAAASGAELPPGIKQTIEKKRKADRDRLRVSRQKASKDAVTLLLV